MKMSQIHVITPNTAKENRQVSYFSQSITPKVTQWAACKLVPMSKKVGVNGSHPSTHADPLAPVPTFGKHRRSSTTTR